MSEQNWVQVVAAGMISPIGADAAMSAASVAADISGVQETHILNKKLTPIKLARVPDDALPELDETLKDGKLAARQQRLLRLAAVALGQLAEILPVGPALPLYLSLPEFLPDHSVPLRGNFIEQLAQQSGIPLNVADSRVATVGRAGSFYAVEKAQQYFAQSGNDYLLIGGVDTYWDPYLLAKLDAEDRLNVLGAFDGFCPGEGAAFLLLGSARVSNGNASPPIRLYKPGSANEVGHRYSQEPYRGDGLASAMSNALQHAQPAKVQSVWTSLIYDSFGHKELGVSLTRNRRQFADPLDIRHPADCLGDMGAAMGCALIGMITAASQSPYIRTRFRHYLLCCSSDLAHRAAIRLDISTPAVAVNRAEKTINQEEIPYGYR